VQRKGRGREEGRRGEEGGGEGGGMRTPHPTRKAPRRPPSSPFPRLCLCFLGGGGSPRAPAAAMACRGTGLILNSVCHYPLPPITAASLPRIATHYQDYYHPLPPITHPLPPITHHPLPPITSVLPASRTPAGGRFFWVAVGEGRRPGGAAPRAA
jgi:hypothetical protein